MAQILAAAGLLDVLLNMPEQGSSLEGPEG